MCNGKTCGLRSGLMETTTLIKWSKIESEIMMGETKGIRLSCCRRKRRPASGHDAERAGVKWGDGAVGGWPPSYRTSS